MTGENSQPAAVFVSEFATYKEIAVKVTPKVPSFSVSQDLNNVSNATDFTFSPETKKLLVKNAFVVQPDYYDEFFPLYESNRYSFTPNFVTTDSMLHNYHLMFDFLLKQLEEQKLATELQQLNTIMLAESLNQYNSLKGTEWENAAKRNVGFFSVGSKLLDLSVSIPSAVQNEVGQELALIDTHQGISESPVMNIGKERDTMIDTPQGKQSLDALKEDYSQYIPRGHYDKTEQLKAYFKSMMWYGRLTFRLKDADEIKSGILITLALNKESNQASWNKIYEPVNFFVGKSDDITYYQFKDLVEKVYGTNATMQTVSSDKNKFTSFVDETKTLEPPQINSMPIFQASIQADREKIAQNFADEWGQVVVLKGANTVIASSTQTAISPFANPILATAGTGDVLAGVIAGLIAQGLTTFDASCVGVYIHGMAGEILREKIGEAGALASDLLPLIPQNLKLIS